MPVFGWQGDGEPPPQWDLRKAGWKLAAFPLPDRRIDLIGLQNAGPGAALPALEAIGDPSRCLFVGVDCGAERAALLQRGAGDALPQCIALAELDQRARRLWAARDHLPRRRELGLLTLDLLHRDARVGGRWLALHPREFGVIWRLADRPGEPVSRARLLKDVWRLDFEPGTNSVEVHVSRLRAKLAAAGLHGIVETDPRGGYRLGGIPSPEEHQAAERPPERLCA